MKIKDIKLKQEGFEKLVEFLHSEKNIVTSGDVLNENSYFEFGLSRAEYTPYGGSEARVFYEVDVVSTSPDPKLEQLSNLLDLIKELYA